MNNENEVENELLRRLEIIGKEEREIRKQLSQIGFNEQLALAQSYVGKYYQELTMDHLSVRCIFVYGINTESANALSVEINYHTEEDGTLMWYKCGFSPYFNHQEWEDGTWYDKWMEITKDEFAIHHQKVLTAINEQLLNEK